ncbi:hypothetical protein TgHK011_007956 [Trichoderma gracile]|nr:hypothetical protein TgHK011_007956 [Trichoderma gracile]
MQLYGRSIVRYASRGPSWPRMSIIVVNCAPRDSLAGANASKSLHFFGGLFSGRAGRPAAPDSFLGYVPSGTCNWTGLGRGWNWNCNLELQLGPGPGTGRTAKAPAASKDLANSPPAIDCAARSRHKYPACGFGLLLDLSTVQRRQVATAELVQTSH